jgi:peptidyl-prolyl cis-trans isomerase SurA
VNIRVSTVARLGRKAAMAAGMAAMATIAVAQTVPDQDVPSTGLNLPSNLQIFGKADPNIRKPNAIVNEAVITGTDVDQRVAMLLAINELKLEAEDLQRLKLQTLRLLVDETLQIQEAKANKIEVTRDEIEQSFVRVSRNFKRTPEQMRTWLRQVGSSERSIKRQIEGDLAWQRVLRRRAPVEVSDAEIAGLIERLKAAKGTPEYRVFEIYLNAPPERAEEVFAAEQQIIEQLKRGADFSSVARAVSEATTRAKGGDLGWVRSLMLPEQLARAAESMQVGQIAGPIEVPGGFSILYLEDKRQVLTADPRDARLLLKQLSIQFAPGTTQAEATNKAAEFARATQKIQGCGDAARVAAEAGAEIVDDDSRTIRELPPQLQQIMLDLQIGQVTQPFGTMTEGVRVLVLCGRDDPQASYEPNPDQVRDSITEARSSVRAQRLLRDLRRDALVEYR